MGGTSIGFSGCFAFTQGWTLTWEDPIVVDFGEGGQFTIDLSDANYAGCFWQGQDGICGDAGADYMPLLPECSPHYHPRHLTAPWF